MEIINDRFKAITQILRRKQVEEITGMKRSSIYQRIKIGNFPAPIKLGDRAVGWISTEIQDWIAEQIKKCRNP